MLVAGIDSGSVASKAVLLDPQTCCPVASAILPTGWNPKETGLAVLEQACARAGIESVALDRIVGTGYGRVAFPFVHKTVTEITCHARGASYLFPDTGVVVDIGGQDSKAIHVGTKGAVLDFVMNDKCAAGTGRFLQVVANILECSLDDLSVAAAQGQPVTISSMCAVFAETEIVGLLARGTPPQDIAAGVYLSIAKRVSALAGRVSPSGAWTFTGGLATSPSFAKALSTAVGHPVRVPEEPQMVGALGAALLAASLHNTLQ